MNGICSFRYVFPSWLGSHSRNWMVLACALPGGGFWSLLARAHRPAEGGQVIKEVAKKQYLNTRYDQPYKQALYNLDVLLRVGKWHINDYLAVVDDLRVHDLDVRPPFILVCLPPPLPASATSFCRHSKSSRMAILQPCVHRHSLRSFMNTLSRGLSLDGSLFRPPLTSPMTIRGAPQPLQLVDTSVNS